MNVKLTDAQLVMLSAAARREDHCLTTPKKMKGAVLAKVGEKLVKLGLVREVRARAGTPVWRRDEAGSFALKLTAAGLKAIAVMDEGSDEAVAESEAPLPRPNPDTTQPSGPNTTGRRAKTAPRVGSKLAQVIDLLNRSDGATISDLIEATGWLPHTTRAALTGLRKRRYAVVRERIDGGDSVYRIAGPFTDDGDPIAVEPRASSDEHSGLNPKANQAA
jgi:hypothetical protein